jgi:hypothetical protein
MEAKKTGLARLFVLAAVFWGSGSLALAELASSNFSENAPVLASLETAGQGLYAQTRRGARPKARTDRQRKPEVSRVLVDRPFQQHGLGLMLLAPTGLSYKFNLDEDQAFDAAFAISSSQTFYVHATYLRKMPWAFDLGSFPVELYYGAGGRVIDREPSSIDRGEATLQMSVRAPVGAMVNFNSPNIEVFSELALVGNVIPKTSVDLTLGLGARYRFNQFF